MKIIKVRNCLECPYSADEYCCYESHETALLPDYEIPDWCKLENVHKDKGKDIYTEPKPTFSEET